MQDYQRIIYELAGLDLRRYPHDKVKELIREFQRFALVQMVLRPGETIIRARPMNPEERFTTRADLSYKQPKFNKTYQRASTPFQTMFYGSVIPQDIPEEERHNARIIVALEVCPLLRTPGQEGEQMATFSRWLVTRDIPLVAVCYYQDYVNKSTHTRNLNEAYRKFCDTIDPSLADSSKATMEYMAKEFSRSDIQGDYDYMRSAIFTEVILSGGAAGVYYPSVRADGMGFNVAISPAVVDSSMRLVAAGECTLYKKGDHTIGDNETVVTIDDDSKPFIYQPPSPMHRLGRSAVMDQFARSIAAGS